MKDFVELIRDVITEIPIVCIVVTFLIGFLLGALLGRVIML